MPDSVRTALIAIGLVFLAVAGYHRVLSQRGGEKLNRTREGWPILLGVRLVGLFTLGCVATWLWNPTLFAWASQSIPEWARWVGVAGFAGAVAWLIWMFRSLGRNLTDTVVIRRQAYFVDFGPYRFVRNPMYTGILLLGASLGLAFGTWLVPLATGALFTMLALRTRTEERYLVERFGEQYRAYMMRVGRFFPKLRS